MGSNKQPNKLIAIERMISSIWQRADECHERLLATRKQGADSFTVENDLTRLESERLHLERMRARLLETVKSKKLFKRTGT
ncbi:hypothetical protein [Caballeronia sp. LZ001]|uniref:hypothetical protein n=1 Tax=Caballeronia sp. LZ001 TaxID=3038553 RepID=UPI00285641FF|nr:hypothetical protein [Caballeronia sp. LZ001]MDR5806477.1 hypothetical protein [Caballeronia sp. LZ001]